MAMNKEKLKKEAKKLIDKYAKKSGLISLKDVVEDLGKIPHGLSKAKEKKLGVEIVDLARGSRRKAIKVDAETFTQGIEYGVTPERLYEQREKYGEVDVTSQPGKKFVDDIFREIGKYEVKEGKLIPVIRSEVLDKLLDKQKKRLLGAIVEQSAKKVISARNIRKDLKELFPDLPEEDIENLTKYVTQQATKLRTKVAKIAKFEEEIPERVTPKYLESLKKPSIIELLQTYSSSRRKVGEAIHKIIPTEKIEEAIREGLPIEECKSALDEVIKEIQEKAVQEKAAEKAKKQAKKAADEKAKKAADEKRLSRTQELPKKKKAPRKTVSIPKKKKTKRKRAVKRKTQILKPPKEEFGFDKVRELEEGLYKFFHKTLESLQSIGATKKEIAYESRSGWTEESWDKFFESKYAKTHLPQELVGVQNARCGKEEYEKLKAKRGKRGALNLEKERTEDNIKKGAEKGQKEVKDRLKAFAKKLGFTEKDVEFRDIENFVDQKYEEKIIEGIERRIATKTPLTVTLRYLKASKEGGGENLKGKELKRFANYAKQRQKEFNINTVAEWVEDELAEPSPLSPEEIYKRLEPNWEKSTLAQAFKAAGVEDKFSKFFKRKTKAEQAFENPEIRKIAKELGYDLREARRGIYKIKQLYDTQNPGEFVKENEILQEIEKLVKEEEEGKKSLVGRLVEAIVKGKEEKEEEKERPIVTIYNEKVKPAIKWVKEKLTKPSEESYIDRGLETCEYLEGETKGKIRQKIKRDKKYFEELRNKGSISEAKYTTGVIGETAHNRTIRALEKQAKNKFKTLGKMEEQVEKSAKEAEAKKPGLLKKAEEGIKGGFKVGLRGLGSITDKIDESYDRVEKKLKELAHYSPILILIILAAIIFSISKPSTTAFIIFSDQGTLNYKILIGTFLFILAVYMVKKESRIEDF